jgi:hypothetical protein
LRLLERVETERGTLFVPLTVSLEIEWVLRSRYGFDKQAVLKRTLRVARNAHELMRLSA